MSTRTGRPAATSVSSARSGKRFPMSLGRLLPFLAPAPLVGGQAVMEGVMMRNGDVYALAVRTADGNISVENRPWFSLTRSELLKKPFLRGFPTLIETLVNGIKALNLSAERSTEGTGEELKDWQLVLTLIVSLLFAVGLFVVVPHLLSIIMNWIGLGGDVEGFSFHIWDGLFKFLIFIGNIVGILPGAGASIACFMGYNEARRFSKHKEEFGKGSIEGVAGSEAANNAVTGGSLIPTLTLGIPGESVTAVLMGGLIIHGLQPGPELFTTYAGMTYTFFAGFVLVQFFMLGVGMLGCKGFAQISRLSDAILIPSIFLLCVVGSYAIHNNVVEVVIMLIFGVIGYLARKFDFNAAAIVLGLILGPIGERGLRRSLLISDGDPSILFSTSLCWILIALCVLGVLSPLLMERMERRMRESAES